MIFTFFFVILIRSRKESDFRGSSKKSISKKKISQVLKIFKLFKMIPIERMIGYHHKKSQPYFFFIMEQPEKKTIQQQYEAKLIDRELKCFKWEESEAWHRLTERFGNKISQDELLSLAQIVSHETDIPLYREFKRRKSMLVKWFETNLDPVWDFIEKHIIVRDVNNKEINFSKGKSQKYVSANNQY